MRQDRCVRPDEVTALIREWGTRCAALEEQNYALREALRTTILNLRTLRDVRPGVRTYDKWLEVTEAVLAQAEGRSAAQPPPSASASLAGHEQDKET